MEEDDRNTIVHHDNLKNTSHGIDDIDLHEMNFRDRDEEIEVEERCAMKEDIVKDVVNVEEVCLAEWDLQNETDLQQKRNSLMSDKSDNSSISTSSSSSSEEDSSDSDQALKKLAAVATRRTSGRESRQGLQHRLATVLRSGDPQEVLYYLLCEIADAVLSRFQYVLGDSDLWIALSDGGYIPGSACKLSQIVSGDVPGCLSQRIRSNSTQGFKKTTPITNETNPYLDIFIQIITGWNDDCIAFDPIPVSASARLAQDLNISESSGITHFFGTYVVDSSMECQLPKELFTERVRKLYLAILEFSKSGCDVNQESPNMLQSYAESPFEIQSLKSVLHRSLAGIESVELGLGGTIKKPSEFQMKYVQRLNKSTLAALESLTNAFSTKPKN